MPRGLMHPLPDLRAGNFRRGGVFHQIVKRHATQSAEPGFEILNADANVPAQAVLGDGAFGHFEQLLRR